MRHAVLTRTFIEILDKGVMLSARAHSGAHRRPLQRLACGVAIALVGSLCLATPTSQAQDSQLKTPFAYSSSMIGLIQTECLFRIAIKESNIRFNAVNRSSGAYGAWQLMHSQAKGSNPYEQVLLAIDYANYRYGSPCQAWEAWKVKRWW